MCRAATLSAPRPFLSRLARTLGICLALVAGAALQAPAGAQTVTTTASLLRGTVAGANGPVSGASVTVDGPVVRSTITQSDGTFRIADLPAGLYKVVVRAKGFDAATNAAVTVSEGETVVTVTLKRPGDSGLKEIGGVSVRTSGGDFNSTSASIQTITAQTLQERDLPTVRQELEAIPGVSVSRSTSYQGNQSTAFDNAEFAIVRGGFPYETGTLLDGHPMYGAVSNEGFSVGFIDAGLLQRVDVVKGPGATTPTINNAIGGTVNFVTIDPRASKPGGSGEIESDGYGGSILKLKYIDHIGSKLSFAFGYQQQESPGPSRGAQSLFALSPYTADTVNGQPFVSCAPVQGCYSNPNTNPAYYAPYGGAPLYFQGILCCTPDYSGYSDRGQVIKLRYDFSPSLYVTAGYFGDQTQQQLGLQGLQSYVFTPPAGYTGSIPAGPVNAASAYNGGSGYLSGSGHTSAFTFDVVGEFHNVILSAKAIQLNQSQTYANGIPFSGTNSVATVPVTARLYGGVATGDPNAPAYNVYNGVPVSFTTTDPAYTYTYGTSLAGLTLQADIPIGSSVYTFALDKTQYAPSFEFAEGQAGLPDYVAANQYAGNFQVIESALARAAFQITPKLQGVASVYFNHYDAHVSTDGNVTFSDHASNYDAPRLGLTWRPQNDLSVRFAAGASIAPAVLTNIVGTNTAPFANNPASPSYYTQYLTNASVRPETAFGYDGGFDYRLRHAGIVASFDVYTTNLINQFFTATTLTGTYNGLPLYTYQTQNIGHARYEGVELSFAHNARQGLFWSASGTLMRAAPYDLPAGFYDQPGLPLSTNLGIISGHNYTGVMGDALNVSVPYSLGNASIGWRTVRSGFIRFDANYYGNNNQYYQPAFVSIDASAGLPLTSKMQLTLSVGNVTNIHSYPYPFTANGYNGGVTPTLANGQLILPIIDGPGPRILRIGVTQRI
jgi:outer membrane receptor protein involved in Fe transport